MPPSRRRYFGDLIMTVRIAATIYFVYQFRAQKLESCVSFVMRSIQWWSSVEFDTI